MLLILAALVGVAWLMGFAVFHIGGVIHLLLLLSLIGIVVHFARGHSSGGRTAGPQPLGR